MNDPERVSRPMWKEKSLQTHLEKKEVWNVVWEKQIALFEYSSRYVFCKKVPQTEICGLTVLRGRSLTSECWQDGFLPGGWNREFVSCLSPGFWQLSTIFRFPDSWMHSLHSPPSPSRLSPHLCVQISTFYKNTRHPGLGPTLITPFLLDYLY